MTDREKAIVMAHTGICMLEGEKLAVFYQYLNELYGRPVYTHEWVTLDIKEKSKPDFLQLCKEEEPERRGRWDNGFCSVCGAEALTEWNDTGGEYAFTTFCPNCGAQMSPPDEE